MTHEHKTHLNHKDTMEISLGICVDDSRLLYFIGSDATLYATSPTLIDSTSMG